MMGQTLSRPDSTNNSPRQPLVPIDSNANGIRAKNAKNQNAAARRSSKAIQLPRLPSNFEPEIRKWIDGYHQFYTVFDYFPAKRSLKAYRRKVNPDLPYRPFQKEKSLEEVAEALKYEHSLQTYKKYLAHPKRNVETGDFVTLEFFKVVLSLIPGNFDFCFTAFLCTLDSDREDGKMDCESLGTFWSSTHTKPAVVREIFFRRPSFNCEKADIFLVLHAFAVDSQLQHKAVAAFETPGGFGIAKIGGWTKKSDETPLEAVPDFSGRVAYLEIEDAEINVAELKKWIPERKLVTSLRDKFLGKKRNVVASFLNMELSNENGLGDFDEEQLEEKKAATPTSPSPPTSAPIREYVLIEERDGSSAPSSSSSPSTDSNEVHTTVECASNSCLVCSATFPSAGELMLHLQTSYPALSCELDKTESTRVNVAVDTNFLLATKFPENALVHRGHLRFIRQKLLSKAKGSEVEEEEPVAVEQPRVVKKKKTFTIDPDNVPLPFNPPVYHPLGPSGLFGVETPQTWLNLVHKRGINEFTDVLEPEKQMMVLWNCFANRRQYRVMTKPVCSEMLIAFATEHVEQINAIGLRQFLLHVKVLFDRKLIDGAVSTECMRILLKLPPKPSTSAAPNDADRTPAKRPPARTPTGSSPKPKKKKKPTTGTPTSSRSKKQPIKHRNKTRNSVGVKLTRTQL